MPTKKLQKKSKSAPKLQAQPLHLANSEPKRGRKRKLKPIMKTNSKEFAALQKKWYSKLAKEGFKDIERQSKHNLGEMQRMTYGKSTYDIIQSFNTDTRHYYRLWTNWCVHNQHLKWPKRYQIVAELFGEIGVQSRIVEELKRRRIRKGANHIGVHLMIKEMEPHVRRWNRISPQGLDYTF